MTHHTHISFDGNRMPPLPIPGEVFEHLPDSSLSLLEVLEQRIKETPDKIAFHTIEMLHAGDLHAHPTSYQEFAKGIAQAIDRLRIAKVTPNTRVVLTLEDVSLFLQYFIACLSVGAIAVPLPSLTSMRIPATFRDRILAVCKDCTPSIIVGAHHDAWKRLELQEVIKHYIDVTDHTTTTVHKETKNPTLSAHTNQLAAYLQYTSGSTGSPRGVLVTHKNLVANLRGITLGGHFIPHKDHSVSWLPLFHDMGLVGGPLLGLYLGFAPYLMTPTQFIIRPHTWLHAMSRFKATFTIAPNFAYALAAYKIQDALIEGVDLSSMRLAFNGAEPINAVTVEAFLDRYADYGFRATSLFPVYGLAEATLAVAFPTPGDGVYVSSIRRDAATEQHMAIPTGRTDQSMDLVCVGRALPEHEVIIRNLEDGKPCPDRTLGRVCVRGPSITPGYFNISMLEKDAVLPTPIEELDTGDLGYLDQNELFVVDRIKDLVIIAGQNFAPSDIERIAGDVDGVRQGRVVVYGAFHQQSGTEGVHVIAEVSPTALEPSELMRKNIQQALRTQLGLNAVLIALVPAGSLPRTSSGKLRRHQTRRMIESGSLPTEDRYDLRLWILLQHMAKQLMGAFLNKPL